MPLQRSKKRSFSQNGYVLRSACSGAISLKNQWKRMKDGGRERGVGGKKAEGPVLPARIVL